MTMTTTSAPPETRRSRPAQPKGRVLVADDELALVRTYQAVLARSGYVVEAATDGVDACALIAHQDYDVVLSDVYLPGVTGIDVAQLTRRRDRKTPVILLTGSPHEEAAMAAAEVGALMYLHKPIDPRVLVQAVDHALHLHQAALAAPAAPCAEADVMEVAIVDDRLEQDLEAGLTSLRVLAQPIVRVSAHALFGYDLSVVAGQRGAPALFELAARLGRAAELGRARRALVARAIDRIPPGARVVVQLSPEELADAEIASPRAPLSRHARRVFLALTDRVPPGEPSERLSKLRGMGFGLAIDDLAVGGSGLSGVVEIAPDMVRIGPSLVHGVDQHPPRRDLVRLLRGYCKSACIRLVMMGVDRPAERELLALLGCDLMQGELFGAPAEGLPAVP